MSGPHPKQASAIGHESGYLLVLAGPGSGKTRVLTERIVRLLQESAGKSFRILALTFTNKAANEMRSRVIAAESDEAPRAFLTTFHSFAADVLRQHGSHIGINPDFSLMTTDDDRLILLRDVCARLSEESTHFYSPTKDLLRALDDVYKETTPKDDFDFSDAVEEDEEEVPLAPLAAAYMREAIARNELDFGLLICASVYLLNLKPNIAKQIRIIYSHVNVDEFQDTNKGQADFLRHLIGPETKSLFLVADDDQVIYEWNGASSQRLVEFQAEYQIPILAMPANYRCPASIVAMANRLAAHNTGRLPGKVDQESHKADCEAETVRLYNFDNQLAETSWIAEDLNGRGEAAWEKSAVLARTKALATSAAFTLTNKGVRAAFSEPRKEFLSSGLVFLHSLLHLVIEPTKVRFLSRLNDTFYKLTGFRVSSNRPKELTEWLREARSRAHAEKEIVTYLDGVMAVVANPTQYPKLIRLTMPFLERTYTGAFTEVSAQDLSEWQYEGPIWDEIEKTITNNWELEDRTLGLFLQEMDLASKVPLLEPQTVRCMTIHAAKGLEFDHVYLIGLVEGTLPSFRSTTEKQIREERRGCFVAITRPMRSLTLTYANKYQGYRKIPSRFLEEMGFTK